MPTEAWFPLRPHPDQSALWRSSARFVAVAAGRGSGKTELARRRVVRFLPVRKAWPDPMYFYALPTRDQAKRVAWEHLKALTPRRWVSDISESELCIRTVFGSSLYLVGMDKPARIEGNQWDGGVVDESSDQKPRSFSLSIRPALSHRRGWCWRIGVPKRVGPGASDFKECWHRWREASEDDAEAYTWTSDTVLPASEIEAARAELDPKDFAEQYRASWEVTAGLVFHAFSDVLNVDDQVQYRSGLPILVGCDFNVDPMAWVLGHAVGSELHVFDEVWLRNTNTALALEHLAKKYSSHAGGWRFYGDATDRARKTSASESDYVQIRSHPRFPGSRVFFPSSNPARADRFAATNAMFCNADNVRRCRVHPRCKALIRDLLVRAYKAGESEPDDHGDVGHPTDALGYLVNLVFPLRVKLFERAPEVVAV